MSRKNRHTKPKNKDEMRIEESSNGKGAETSTETGSVSNSPKGRNDATWYGRDPQLLADAARINWTFPFGVGLRLGFDYKPWFKLGNKPVAWKADSKLAFPGILTLRCAPSMGASMDIKDPANMAAQSLYTMVRYVNSGRKNYDAPDLLIYENSVTDVYAYIVFCERIYAYAFQYSQNNFYIGKDLIKACGIDPDSVINNLANFRYYINSLINKVSAYALPAEVTMASKRVFQYQTYYMENSFGNLKDQLYQFAPSHFYKFGHDSSGVGCLDLVEFFSVGDSSAVISNLKTIEQVMAFGTEMLNAFWGDEDFGLMSGDILKAFEGKIITLSSMPDDYSVVPIFDPYVLSMMKNAKLINMKGCERFELPYVDLQGVSGLKTITNGGVYQSPNGVILSGVASGDFTTQLFALSGTLLSSENPVPGVDDTIEAVQLCYAYRDHVSAADDNTEYTDMVMLLDTFGYFATECTYYYNTYQGSASAGLIRLRQFNITGQAYVGGSEIGVSTARFIASFKYGPMMFSITTSEDNTFSNIETCDVISNVDNYTVVPAATMSRLAEVSLLSLLYVPGVAKYMNY